jgi:hypothetical protein
MSADPHPHTRHFHTDVEHLAVCFWVCVVAPKNLVTAVEVRIWHVVQTVVRWSPLCGSASQKETCKQNLCRITPAVKHTPALLVYGGEIFLPKVIMKGFMAVLDLSS